MAQKFRKRVEAMGITEVVTAPRSPWQNAYVERVIGPIRRECLDQVVIFNERHLRRVLSSYVDYYHRTRTHLSLDKDCPHSRPIQPPRNGRDHRHSASRRVAPSLRTPRGVTSHVDRWFSRSGCRGFIHAFLLEACPSYPSGGRARFFDRSQFRSIAANDTDRPTDSNFG